MVWMHHSLFIHSPDEGHLGCFSGEVFDGHQLRGEARDAARHPTTHRAPHNRELSNSDGSSAEVEKPCSEYILDSL